MGVNPTGYKTCPVDEILKVIFMDAHQVPQLERF
jgi:hypothetical protein